MPEASLIKRLLLEGESRAMIKIKVAEEYPEVPLSNIGCQIGATICYLKKKGEYANGNEEI